MGGSVGGSFSQSKNSFGQEIPQWQVDAFNSMFGQGKRLFKDTKNQMNQLIPGATNYMQGVAQDAMPAWQDTLQGGAYKDMDLQNNLMNSLNQSLQNPSAMQDINASIMGGSGNNYADAMKAAYVGDANRATDNMLANLDARAAASGMSGGSRHGIATSQGLYDINSNLQRNLAETGYNTFEKDLDRKLGIAQQADQNTLARQGMLQNMIGNQQDTVNSGLNFGSALQQLGMGQFAPSMAPWDAFNSYSNALGSPTVLSSGKGSSFAMGQSASGGVK